MRITDPIEKRARADRHLMAVRRSGFVLRKAEPQELDQWPTGPLAEAARVAAERGHTVAVLVQALGDKTTRRLAVVGADVLARADRLPEMELQQISLQRAI